MRERRPRRAPIPSCSARTPRVAVLGRALALGPAAARLAAARAAAASARRRSPTASPARCWPAAEAVDRAGCRSPDHPVFRQVAQGAHPDLTVLEPERDPRTGQPQGRDPGRRGARGDRSAAHDRGDGRLSRGRGRRRRRAESQCRQCAAEDARGAAAARGADPGQPAARRRSAATIRSRCAKLALAPLPDALVVEALARLAPELTPEQRARARAAGARQPRPRPRARGRRLARRSTGASPSALAAAPVDRLALHELARRARAARRAARLRGAADLLQELLAPASSRRGRGRLGPRAVRRTSRGARGALAAGRPLDRWAALWDKVAPAGGSGRRPEPRSRAGAAAHADAAGAGSGRGPSSPPPSASRSQHGRG